MHPRLAIALALLGAGCDRSPIDGPIDRSLIALPDKLDYALLLEAAADVESPEGYVVFKVADATGARVVDGRLVASDASWQARLEEIHDVLDAQGLVGLERELGEEPAEDLDAERERILERARVDVGDLNLFLVAGAPEGVDRVVAARALNELAAVEIAYAMPKVVPAQTACRRANGCGAPQSCDDPRECQYTQRYLEPEPAGRGIEARRLWCVDGGRGEGVTIYDLEQGWNREHAEFDDVGYLGDWPPASRLGEEPPTGAQRDNMQHGTAVLGEMVSRDDGRGTTGIAPAARAVAVDVQRTPFFARLIGRPDLRLYAFPAALRRAIRDASPGDVLLIEQHMPTIAFRACTDNRAQCGFVPMELLPEVPALIRQATANGIHVVEAAGNGSQDLDASGYLGRFDRSRFDSGAIMVGATGLDWVTPATWTNFGRRVDVHGFGNGVVTTGYGDLFELPDECTPEGTEGWSLGRQSYTSCFSGTSSASPIVTGAVALLEGVARSAGVTLEPRCLRSALVETGIRQEAEPERAIGPLPFTWAALDHMAELPAPPATEAAGGACVDADLECVTGVDCAEVPFCHATARGMRCARACVSDLECGAGEVCSPSYDLSGDLVLHAGQPLRICGAAPLTERETACLCGATSGLVCAGGRHAGRATDDEPPPIDPSVVVTLDAAVDWNACERVMGHRATVRFEECVMSPVSGGGCRFGPGHVSGIGAGWLSFLVMLVLARRLGYPGASSVRDLRKWRTRQNREIASDRTRSSAAVPARTARTSTESRR